MMKKSDIFDSKISVDLNCEKIKNVFVIDGYNVLRCAKIYSEAAGISPNFLDWTDEAFNKARGTLLNHVCMMTDSQNKAVIVYDSTRPTQKLKPSEHVRVIFSGQPKSADERIERVVAKLSCTDLNVTVVSNDHVIQSIALKYGAARQSADEFASSVKYAVQDINDQVDNNVCEQIDGDLGSLGSEIEHNGVAMRDSHHQSSTIEDLVDSKTKQKLEDLLDELL